MRPADRTTGLAAPILVRIELGSGLSFGESSETTRLQRRLTSELAVLFDRLGVPGEPAVEVGTTDSNRPVRISVHGRPQPYSPDLLRRAWLAVAPPELRELPSVVPNDTDPGFPAGWLSAYARGSESEGRGPSTALIAAMLERLTVQVVVEHPSCLLGAAQVDAYAMELGCRPQWLETLLRSLLDLGASLENREVIRRVTLEGEEIDRAPEDTIEAAFTELRSHAIEIHVHPATLRELVPVSSGHERLSVYDPRIGATQRDLFRNLERTFFSAFGFILPGLYWVPAPGMAERSVAVRVGAWRGLPLPMLPPDKRLVMATVEELPVPGALPAVNPITGTPCAVVDDGLKSELEQHGYTTWGRVDFVIVILVSELSRRAGTLLGMEEIEYQLAQLRTEGEEPLPASARTALTLFSLGDVTRVLRALVDERLSLRDLPGLLERLVQFDTVPLDQDRTEVVLLDDRLPISPHVPIDEVRSWPTYYAFLRRQLSPYLSYFHAGGDRRIRGYALEPEIERRAKRSPPEFTDRELESFRDAVWKELASSPPDTGQLIVTTTGARAVVRELLAPEFPDLSVLAYSELSPDVDLERLGTISAFAPVSAE